MKKRIFALVLALCIVLTMVPAAFAAGYHDTEDHWAEDAIARWSQHGIVEGNEGLFSPDAQLTRGQLAVIIARLLNLPAAPDAGFGDTDGHWAEDMINRCAAAGIMQGDGVNANPDKPVSREETMVLLGRALGIKPVENADLSHYGDDHAVSDWAEGYVAAMTGKGIVNGIDGNLAPAAEIDRASTMTILDRAITTYVTEPGTTVESDGGIVVVAAEDVTITGEAAAVVVTQGAAGGTTTLDNVNVETVTVQAENTSVVVGENTVAVEVEVTAQATGTAVEVAKDAAVGTVTTAAAESSVTVSGTVQTVETTEQATGTTVEVTKTATVENVTAGAAESTVTVSGTVTNVTVSDTATGATVEASKGAAIENVTTEAENTTVTGNGKVENVTTSGNNTTVETGGTKVEAAEGTTGTTAGGETVTGGESATTTPTTPSTPSTPTVPEHVCVVVSSVVTAPTCTEKGYTTHTTCCGYSYVADYVDALDHAWGDWTANDDGTHTRVCGNDSAHTETEDCSYVEGGDVCECGFNRAAEAKVGDKYYETLQAALDAVEDGDAITVLSNITIDENTRYNLNGYYEGVYYEGDKSFTIDLSGKTITNDSSVNDYLMLFKNAGEKTNTITFKNGTIDAGTTAYCAICTSTSSTQQITVNLENVNVIGNNSNGSVAKIRGGAVLNVKDGTVITGKDSFLGIENWNATVNIYDGAKIYMNGTTSYNGCLVGVGGNGTVNVYGGFGKGAQGGLIAMTSGGTINVSGGEWIANTDGSYANDNKSVLIAQNDKATYSSAGNSVVNVTGGTFKGGYNCYGNAVGDAQLNISGGNFNSDPSDYVAEGYEATKSGDVWTVGEQVIDTEEELIAAIKKGQTTIELADGAYTMPDGSESVDLRGKTLTIIGTKKAVIDVSAVDARDQFVTGATLKFEGVTLNFGVENYMGFANTASLTYKNCDINGLQFLFGESVTFENCKIDSSANTKEPHSVWTYGAKKVSFSDCNFTYGNRGINCYSDNDVDGGKQTVNFMNCTFTTSATDSEGAVEINSCFFSVGIEVNLTGCTAPAYGEMAYVSKWDSTNGAKTTINIE